MTLWSQLTDAQREALVTAIVGALPTSGIPDHLRAGLVRYFSDGILPGGFLQAVLCNDLTQAVKRNKCAGDEQLVLSALIDFLLEHAPSPSWGSREAVLGWAITSSGLEIAPRTETAAESAYELFTSMRTPELLLARYAYDADTQQATTPESLVFGGGRLALMTHVLKTRLLRPTYELVPFDGHPGIRCLLCKSTSPLAGDVENKYCARCHLFHNVVADARRAIVDGGTHDCDEWATALGACALCTRPVQQPGESP